MIHYLCIYIYTYIYIIYFVRYLYNHIHIIFHRFLPTKQNKTKTKQRKRQKMNTTQLYMNFVNADENMPIYLCFHFATLLCVFLYS